MDSVKDRKGVAKRAESTVDTDVKRIAPGLVIAIEKLVGHDNHPFLSRGSERGAAGAESGRRINAQTAVDQLQALVGSEPPPRSKGCARASRKGVRGTQRRPIFDEQTPFKPISHVANLQPIWAAGGSWGKGRINVRRR